MGVLAAAGDVFDVGAAGKGAAGVSRGVSGILQSARRGAVSDAASDMAGLLWQQWMLGENAELSQMRRAMLAAAERNLPPLDVRADGPVMRTQKGTSACSSPFVKLSALPNPAVHVHANGTEKVHDGDNRGCNFSNKSDNISEWN